MKKILVVLALISVFTMSVFAQETESQKSTGSAVERDESKWTDLSYVNIPVLKIMESNDGYVVLYQKNICGVGRTVVPKAWAKGSPETPRRLKFRNVKSENEAYMTVLKKGGEFKCVVINVPMNKSSYIWGVVDRGIQLEGVDKASLEELEL